jgi:prepilin-type N-terminal cleavage/methylation domain-containing protein
MMINSKFQIPNSKKGFTLIELIIYLAIVGIILTGISYLILDVLGAQITNYTDQEINYHVRYITDIITKDIESAQDISSIAFDNLVLTMPGDDITYNFDGLNSALTRQIGSSPPVAIHSDNVEVSGTFTELSRLNRTKNVNIHLEINYKNPGNLSDYNSSTTVNLAVELRGRK